MSFVEFDIWQHHSSVISSSPPKNVGGTTEAFIMRYKISSQAVHIFNYSFGHASVMCNRRVYIYIYIHTHIYVCEYVFIIWINGWVYNIYGHMPVSVYIYICIYMCVCIFECIYIIVCESIWVYIFIEKCVLFNRTWILSAGTIYQPLRSGRIWHKVNFFLSGV